MHRPTLWLSACNKAFHNLIRFFKPSNLYYWSSPRSLYYFEEFEVDDLIEMHQTLYAQLLLHGFNTQCNYTALCLWVCVWGVCVCGSYHELEIACINPHQSGFVGEGNDHFQLIKFCRAHAPGNGVCGGAKIFGSALLQPARSVCVSPSAFSLLLPL